MSDELKVLKLVAGRLDNARIPYMMSGSMALSYYAQPRMTRDIDLVVQLAVRDAERLASLFTEDFVCEVEAVRDAARRRGMFNIIHEELVVKVDFVVRKDTAYRREEFSRRREVVIDEARISLVTAEDLLLSKLDWAKPSHSQFQLRDVRHLIASVPDLDWPYIEHWAAELDLAELLSEVRS